MSVFTTTVYNPYSMEQFQRHLPVLDHMRDYHDDVRTMPAREGTVPHAFIGDDKRGYFI